MQCRPKASPCNLTIITGRNLSQRTLNFCKILIAHEKSQFILQILLVSVFFFLLNFVKKRIETIVKEEKLLENDCAKESLKVIRVH